MEEEKENKARRWEGWYESDGKEADYTDKVACALGKEADCIAQARGHSVFLHD